jgi:ligand-binding sensor domain-containing protein
VGFLPGRLDEIARFDGNRWDVFTANALMQLAGVASTGAEPRIHLAFPGVAGKVWFAIDDSFISYNGRDWSAYPGLLRVIDSRPKGGVVPISAALENEDGRVWSAVSHLGIFTLDERTRDFTPTQGVAEELRGLPQGLTDGRADITSIYEDTSGRTWFPDASGWLYIRSNRDQSWSSVSLLNALDVTHRYGVQPVYLTLASGSPRALDDGEGMLTFATERGVAAFFKRTGRWALIDSTGGLLPADRVLCITRDHSGRIWIGTDSGLAVFER